MNYFIHQLDSQGSDSFGKHLLLDVRIGWIFCQQFFAGSYAFDVLLEFEVVVTQSESIKEMNDYS